MEVERENWTPEQIQFRDTQTEIIGIAEREEIPPTAFLEILEDLVKNFKEEIEEEFAKGEDRE